MPWPHSNDSIIQSILHLSLVTGWYLPQLSGKVLSVAVLELMGITGSREIKGCSDYERGNVLKCGDIFDGSTDVNQTEACRNSNGLCSVRRPEFLNDVIDVKIDRSFAYAQNNRNVPRAFSLIQPVQNFFFAGRKHNIVYIGQLIVEDMREGQVQMGGKQLQYGDGAHFILHSRA